MRAFGVLLAAGLVVAVMGGCSTLSTVNPRAASIDDIISMTRAGVGSEVIKSHIEATHSRFQLSSGDIVRLKKEGVADDLLKAMIQTENISSAPPLFDWENPNWGFTPYDNFNYYNYPTGYYLSPYDYPYIVFRQPGLLGRFYNYYPLDLYPEYGPYDRYIPPYPYPYPSPDAGKSTNPDASKPSNP
ncbi:MAG: hypothetical protein Q8O92_07430 [Candidatus Latescibacter sp.]|nr:hypothetical protein [Candidatus Latescibacter sp.]